MLTCRICQNTFKSLKFKTKHIEICTRCVNSLNTSPEPAMNAEARLAEKLARGMQRNSERDLGADEEWKRRKAQHTLDNLDAAVAAKLHDWITKLLADSSNSTRDFKVMRAHRRGLLRMDGFADRLSGDARKEMSSRVRRRDDNKCMVCGSMDRVLDVHHIVYLSHHGTNQQNNLVTLCRPCHEAEHQRVFDWLESQDENSEKSTQPYLGSQSPQPMQTPQIAKRLPEIIKSAPQLDLSKTSTTKDTVKKDSSLISRHTSAIDEPRPKSPHSTIHEKMEMQNKKKLRARVFLVTTFCLILLALALPAYQDYVSRSKYPQESYRAPEPRIKPESKNNGGESLNLSPKPSTQSTAHTKTADHYQQIYSAHPDADLVFNSTAFQDWIEKNKMYRRIIKEGTAHDIIEMFTAYKMTEQLYGPSSGQRAEPPKNEDAQYLPSLSIKSGGLAPQTANPNNDATTCIFKPVMTDADYRACGITPSR